MTTPVSFTSFSYLADEEPNREAGTTLDVFDGDIFAVFHGPAEGGVLGGFPDRTLPDDEGVPCPSVA